jgi:hypothetical protein
LREQCTTVRDRLPALFAASDSLIITSGGILLADAGETI